MTIKKKVLLLSTAILALTSLSAQAAVIRKPDFNLDTGEVTISGMGFDSYNGKDVTLLITKNGKTADNFGANDVEKQAQAIIENGEFKIKFLINKRETDTDYTAYINAAGQQFTGTFKAISKTSVDRNAASVLSDKIVSTADLENIKVSFNLHNTSYADITDKDAVAEITSATWDPTTDDAWYTGTEELRNLVAKAAAVQALNEGKASTLLDGTSFIYPEQLGFDTLDANKGIKAYEQYTTELSEAGKQAVIAAISNKGYTSYDEFINDFILQTTINAIKRNKNNGTDHISGVLNDNNAVNGLTFANYNANQDAINALLMSESYSTKEQLQAVLNTAISSDDDTPSTKPEPSRPSQTGNGPTFAPTITVKDGVEEFVFADVTENYSWARDAIKELYEAGIISGKSSDTFAPADYVTRAEFLKILMGVVEIEVENGTSEFNDVKASDWYHDYVVTAAKLGLVNGISETEFGANNNITRQDACVMIARACEIAGKALPAGTAKEFEDADFVSEYAKESVDLLSGAGIVQGTDNRFLPRANCTRAEAAVMLKNVLDKIEG